MSKYWSEEELARLPRDGVFALRGHNVSRLETFVDAAFAFAVTLLVISIDNIPDNYDAFVEALLQTPAFVVCFFQLMMFWLGHRTWSRRYGLDSGAVVWISLFLVAGVLVIVYPLRLMFGAAMAFMTDDYLPTGIDFSLDQLRTVFVLYGCGFGLLSMLIAALFGLALRHEGLNLSIQERFATKSNVVAWLILGSTGLVSVLIALSASGMWIIAAGWIYMSLTILMPLQAWYSTRELRKLKPH